jgi:hypothetical protein
MHLVFSKCERSLEVELRVRDIHSPISLVQTN